LKTTTAEGKRDYMRRYMRDKLGVDPNRYGKRGPKPIRYLAKDFQKLKKKVTK